MINRTVATKLTEEEHSKLIDFCNGKGCTPSSLIKEAILGKISPKEETKEPIKETETTEPKKEYEKSKNLSTEELKKLLGIKKSEPAIESKVETRRQPTLEETLDHMKNCRNPDCKYGRQNFLKNLQ